MKLRRKALSLVPILLAPGAFWAASPDSDPPPAPSATAGAFPAALETPAYRSTACASESCAESWRARLLIELIFDDGFEQNGVCSVLWTDWIGSCGPNQQCSGGACACSAGYTDCNFLSEDGCECATPLCCAGSCAPEHSNGLGQSYYDCSPLGTPGDGSTYTLSMATAARAAWSPGTDSAGTCGMAQALSRTGAGECAVWAYTTSLAGHVRVAATCLCPTAGDATWN